MDPKPKVDFRKIAPRNGSQANAFEELCCQIARRGSDRPAEGEFVRLRGAGGDGGVECLWRLPNGEEWGWQAKYMFSLSKAKSALDQSFATAVEVHPGLSRYTICLPFDLTGPTAKKTKRGVNAKSELDRFNEYRALWESVAKARGMVTKLSLHTAATLLDELLAIDPEGGRLRFWFDESVLSDSWFALHLEDVKASAYPRYTPELRIETPIAEAFDAFGLTDEWFHSLGGRCNEFKRFVDDWNEGIATTSDHGWGLPTFPEEIRPLGKEASDLLVAIAEHYRQLALDRNVSTDIDDLAINTERALTVFRELRSALAAALRISMEKALRILRASGSSWRSIR